MVEKVALMTALILGRPMCLECIRARAGLAMDETIAILGLIEIALTSHRQVARCQACGVDGLTVSVDPPLI